MKKSWSVTEAIKLLGGEYDVETNVVKVPFPLNSIRKCGAYDYLKNHSRVRVISKIEK